MHISTFTSRGIVVTVIVVYFSIYSLAHAGHGLNVAVVNTDLVAKPILHNLSDWNDRKQNIIDELNYMHSVDSVCITSLFDPELLSEFARELVTGNGIYSHYYIPPPNALPYQCACSRSDVDNILHCLAPLQHPPFDDSTIRVVFTCLKNKIDEIQLRPDGDGVGCTISILTSMASNRFGLPSISAITRNESTEESLGVGSCSSFVGQTGLMIVSKFPIVNATVKYLPSVGLQRVSTK